MTNPTIRFIRRGQVVTLVNVPPTRTLLEVLREDLGSTGTKEGCGEGDCGACTVVLGEAVEGRIEYRAINACIRLAHSIDGLALWTAEDLASDPLIGPSAPKPSRANGAAGLHPVQEALVQCHGSQCGFCTPGFAMSLFGLYQTKVPGAPVTRDDAASALSGNLCRCTGYRPIVDAAVSMDRFPVQRVNEAELLTKLEHIKSIPRWGSADFDPDSIYMTPNDLPQLLALRRQHPEAQTGGRMHRCRSVDHQIAPQFDRRYWTLRGYPNCSRVERYPHHIAIGAAVTLDQRISPLWWPTDRTWPSFAHRFAGLPVRNSGTLGGNVANGSPIGDSMPLLIALGAQRGADAPQRQGISRTANWRWKISTPVTART
jgi:xanthine dehydrogenase small subunit